MKIRVLLLPFAVAVEFFGLVVSLILALLRMDKQSYFIVSIFENWPNPSWYFSGWRMDK